MNQLLGLPAHPLFVHASVVLVPMAAIGVVALALVPRWRARFGIVVLAIAVAGGIFTLLTTESGESLQESVPETALVQQHADLGNTAVWFVAPLVLVAIALWWLGRRGLRSEKAAAGASGTTSGSTGAKPLATWLNVVVMVVTIVIAAAATVQFVRIGDAGAQATWGDVQVKDGGEQGD